MHISGVDSETARRWVARAGYAVFDQGAVSGANFVSAVLLARWLGPEEYGSYGLAFSGLLFVSMIYQALILEPMSVLGPAAFKEDPRFYLTYLLLAHAALSLLSAAGLSGAAFLAHRLMGSNSVANALFGLAFSLPFTMLLGLLRSVSYLRLDPRPAAQAAASYAALFLLSLTIAHELMPLNPRKVFVIMGAASLIVSTVFLQRLRIGLSADDIETPRAYSFRRVCIEHWRYGRWALGSGGVNWLWENSWYLIGAAVLTMRDVGGLRAAGNLILPLAQSAAACGRLVQPWVSNIFGEHGPLATRVPVQRISLIFVSVSAAYCMLITVLADRIFIRLYGPEFQPFASLFPLIALNYLVGVALQNGFSVGLRAIQCPDSVFIACAAGAVLAAVLSIPAARVHGLHGVIWASVAASILSSAISIWLYQAKLRNVSAP